MGKTHTTLSIDEDVLTWARSQYIGKVSSMFENYLRSLMNVQNKDINGLTLEKERLRLQQKAKELAKLKAETDQTRLNVEELERKAQEAKQQQIEKEQEMIIATKRCAKCGNEGDRTVKGHCICRACWLGSDLWDWLKKNKVGDSA